MGRTIVTTAVVSLAAFSAASAKSISVYIGTYTGGGSGGIYRTTLDLHTGALAEPVLAAQTRNPSFVELHPSGKYLYAVSEGGGAGAVTAFAIDPTGDLKRLNQQPSGGAGPCHINVDHAGRNVLVANYGSGSASVIPIRPDGSLGSPTGFVQHTGSGPNAGRQKGPHAHSVNVSPDDRFAFVADLGIDRIMIYKLDVDAGTIVANDPPFASLAPGAGPRHFAFTPDGKYAYVINELNSTMTAFAYDSATGALAEVQTVPTLPAGFAGSSYCAEVRVHPSGRFLYGSNRGHDSIAVFAVDAATGRLTPTGHTPTGGRWPRHFTVDPTGQYLLAANQHTDDIVVFRIDPASGSLTQTAERINVPSPSCIAWWPR